MVKQVKCIKVPDETSCRLTLGKTYNLSQSHEAICKMIGMESIYNVVMGPGLIGQYPKELFEEIPK